MIKEKLLGNNNTTRTNEQHVENGCGWHKHVDIHHRIINFFSAERVTCYVNYNYCKYQSLFLVVKKF
jgi:hypothetical protein